MTPAMKKICLFGLAEGIGKMMIKQTQDEKVLWRAEKLIEVGELALNNCKVKITKSIIKKTKDKINSIYKNKEEFNIVVLLSFLLCGVQELIYYSKQNKQNKQNEILLLMEKRLLWFIKFYDPKLEQNDLHQEAYNKYEKWTECY